MFDIKVIINTRLAISQNVLAKINHYQSINQQTFLRWMSRIGELCDGLCKGCQYGFRDDQPLFEAWMRLSLLWRQLSQMRWLHNTSLQSNLCQCWSQKTIQKRKHLIVFIEIHLLLAIFLEIECGVSFLSSSRSSTEVHRNTIFANIVQRKFWVT